MLLVCAWRDPDKITAMPAGLNDAQDHPYLSGDREAQYVVAIKKAAENRHNHQVKVACEFAKSMHTVRTLSVTQSNLMRPIAGLQ